MMRLQLQPGRINGWEHHIGAFGILGMVLMIVLWVAVIVALIFGIRALIIHSRRSAHHTTPVAPVFGPAATQTPPATPVSGVTTGDTAISNPTLIAILEERYAKGEIDRDEFLQRKQDLGLIQNNPT